MKDKIYYFFSIFFSRAAGVIASLALMKFIITEQGAESWGAIILLLSLFKIFTIVTNFGQGNYLLSLRDKLVSEKSGAIFGNTVLLSLLVSVLIWIIGNRVSLWSDEVTFYAVIGIPFYSLLAIGIKFFQKKDNRVLFNILNGDTFAYIILICFVTIELCGFLKLNYLLLFLIIIIVMSLIVGVIVAAKLRWHEMTLFDTQILKKSSFFLFGSSLLMLMGWMDTFFLGFFKSENEVGLYNVIFRIASIATFILSISNAVIAPRLRDLYESQMSYFKKIVKLTNRFNVVVTLGPLILVFVYLSQILTFFGVGLESQNLLKIPSYILLIAYFINSACGNVGYILQMTGRVQVFNTIISLSAIVNLILNIVLIPSFGILGAAIATGIGMIFWNIISFIYVKKNMDFYAI